MLELFTKHGGFDLTLKADGDLDVDQHHTVEDVGIVLGQLFAKALGDRKGINRAGYFVLPMDETLAVVAVDLGGRPALVYKDLVKVRLVGDLQTELVEDFFGGFVHHAGANLHAKVLYGRSNHHKLEAIFKCFARAMKFACSKDARLKDQLPSTKASYEPSPHLSEPRPSGSVQHPAPNPTGCSIRPRRVHCESVTPCAPLPLRSSARKTRTFPASTRSRFSRCLGASAVKSVFSAFLSPRLRASASNRAHSGGTANL